MNEGKYEKAEGNGDTFGSFSGYEGMDFRMFLIESKIKKVPADGHCLLHSISNVVKMRPSKIRSLLCAYI